MSMTLPAARISERRLVTRLSSSPRSLAPAMSSPRSSCITRFPFRNAGSGAPSGSVPAWVHDCCKYCMNQLVYNPEVNRHAVRHYRWTDRTRHMKRIQRS